MAVWFAYKICWRGAKACARVDGFEKNASQNTRRPSPKPVNFCLDWLFTIELLDILKKRTNYCENCPKLKFVGDSKIIGPQGISLQQQKQCDFERDIAQKGNL